MAVVVVEVVVVVVACVALSRLELLNTKAGRRVAAPDQMAPD